MRLRAFPFEPILYVCKRNIFKNRFGTWNGAPAAKRPTLPQQQAAAAGRRNRPPRPAADSGAQTTAIGVCHVCDKFDGEILNFPPEEREGETGAREPGDGGEVGGWREGCDGASEEEEEVQNKPKSEESVRGDHQD